MVPEPSGRVAAFSLQRIGVNIGWAAGPAVASVVLAAGGSYSGLFYWSAPVTLVAAIGIARIKETRLPAAAPAARLRFLDLFHIPADLRHGKYRNDRARELLHWQPRDNLDVHWRREV